MRINDWFIGVVEDDVGDDDTGRVRVRCLGYHSLSRDDIPTEHLPYATVLLPTTVPGVGGNGRKANLKVGSWVLGFFRDGSELQEPVIVCSVPGAEVGGEFNTGYDATTNFGFGDSLGAHSNYDGSGTPASGPYATSGSVGISTGGYGDPNEITFTPSGDAGTRLVNVARSQLGVIETTNDNQGPGIDKYWKATTYPNGMAKKEPWCAAFASWVIQESKILPPAELPRTSGVSEFLNWANRKPYAQRINNPRSIAKGDLVFLKSSSHIGIATTDSDASGGFRSIDGNTGAPGGRGNQGVHEKPRRVSGMRAIIRIVPPSGGAIA